MSLNCSRPFPNSDSDFILRLLLLGDQFGSEHRTLNPEDFTFWEQRGACTGDMIFPSRKYQFFFFLICTCFFRFFFTCYCALHVRFGTIRKIRGRMSSWRARRNALMMHDNRQ